MNPAQILFQETYSALLSNKVRSGLTVLGIVIGIGSVIAMIAIGAGAQSMIQSNIQSLGSNLIIVMPGAQRGPGVQVSSGRGSAQSLTIADAEAIQKEISSVKALAPEVSRRYQVTARGANTNTQIIGTNDFYPSVRNIEIGEGSFITEQNIRTAAKIAVFGPAARDDLFGEGANPIEQTIRIQRADFKVIGVTKSKGGSGFNNPDDSIFISFSSARRFLTGNEYLTEIRVKKGEKVKIIFNNKEGFHDWVIDEFNTRTPKLQSGQTAEVEFVADKTGSFEYYCSIGSHRAMGMKGKLIVE